MSEAILKLKASIAEAKTALVQIAVPAEAWPIICDLLRQVGAVIAAVPVPRAAQVGNVLVVLGDVLQDGKIAGLDEYLKLGGAVAKIVTG